MAQSRIEALNLIDAANYMFGILAKEMHRLEEPLNKLVYAATDYHYNRRIEVVDVTIDVLSELIEAKLIVGHHVAYWTRSLVMFQKRKVLLTKEKSLDNAAKN